MVERDSKGRFVNGHTPIDKYRITGIKCGRKKALKTKVKDALLIAEDAMPQIIAMLTKQAKKGDTQAAKLLLGYVYGMPKQSLDLAGRVAAHITSQEVKVINESDIKPALEALIGCGAIVVSMN